MTATATLAAAAADSNGYTTLGTRPVRHDGHDKVTGRARYGADFHVAGMLHGKALRSPHAHARIASIRTGKAEALSGVRAIVTALDIPSAGEDTSTRHLRTRVLARDKVLFKGHAVAAVAATSPHAAEEALGLIEVEYEVLPAVLTAPEAMKDGAPILHADLKSTVMGRETGKVGNLAEHFQHRLGDVEAGFAQADVVVQREVRCRTVHQGYIEPNQCTALWNEDGRLTVWCSTQGSFRIRDRTAQALGLPVSRVTVVPLEIGGGFGGKTDVYMEPVAALLSRRTGRPVKMVMTRQEVFEATGPTSGSFVRVKMGATRDGRLTAAQAYLAYEAGAFPGSAVYDGAEVVFASYDIPNIALDAFDVVVNKPKTEPYRAPGAPNAAIATEQVVDELAERLGMDPVDFRLANASREGTRRATGPAFPKLGCVELLEAMKAHPHYGAPLGGPNRGRGVAVGFWFTGGGASSCYIAVNADGTLSLTEGSVDIGGSRAAIAMQAAEVLGVPAEDVHPTVVDTDSIGYTEATWGSRTTYSTGLAAYEAAQDVRRQMLRRAAAIWEVDPASVDLTGGVFHSTADPKLRMAFKELAGRLARTGGAVAGRADVVARGAGGSSAGNIVDVEVDPETGKVTLLRLTAFQDAGRAIHPGYVEGQMQGGTAQGIGWALNEEYFYNDRAEIANSSFLDYRMPTALDMPMIDTVIIEVPNPAHPFGVRGVGEANIIPPTPAIANAIYRAVGFRTEELPLKPGVVVRAILDRAK